MSNTIRLTAAQGFVKFLARQMAFVKGDIPTDAGGTWWEVAVPEVSVRPQVNEARKSYEAATQRQRIGD